MKLYKHDVALHANVSGHSGWETLEIAAQVLELKCLQSEKGALHDSTVKIRKGSALEIQKLLESSDYRLYRKTLSNGEISELGYALEEDTLVSLTTNMHPDEGVGHVRFITTSEERFITLREALKPFEDNLPTTGAVFVLFSSEHGGCYLKELGNLGKKLERSNYVPEVLTNYDLVKKALINRNKNGRLIVLTGPPGTGKTYLIRGLIEETPKNQFVIVPPSMIDTLAEPLMLPYLTKFCKQARDKDERLVLILEDADMCLVPRQGDNMSVVSALLNFGDGLLGEGLDIRVISTTNSSKVELDKAVKRSQRLLAHIDVPMLSPEVANNVAKSLNSKTLYETDVSLAKVYEDASVE